MTSEHVNEHDGELMPREVDGERLELTESGWVLPVSQTAVDHVWWKGRRA